MILFFKPYEGKRPFLFISYAHRQSEAVIRTIRILHDKNYRLWYDEGIPAGSDWPANIAEHMQSCERVIFFLSARSMESQNCYSEMRTAFRLKKPILVVPLEDVELEPRWRELLCECPAIPLLPTAEERAEAILRAGFVPRRYRHSWTERIPWRAIALAASLLLFLGSAGVLGALLTGRWSPVPPPPSPVVQTPEPSAPTPEPSNGDWGGAERFFIVRFANAQMERAVRNTLGVRDDDIYQWQLAEIKGLYFCGNVVTDGLSSISFDPDGTCRANGAPVITGTLSDLSLLENAISLEELALACQPLGSLDVLSGHVLLRELSLAGSSVSSVSSLGELPSLETLHLEHTAVSDLRPLEKLPRLRTVTVSRDMLPLRWDESAAFAVILVN